MIAIVCTQGQMRYKDIVGECREQQWVPIVVYRQPGKPPTVLSVPSDAVARQFVRRNFPKQWLCGSVKLTEEDVAQIQRNGWLIEEMHFPRKMTNYELDVEVLQLAAKPDVMRTG